MLTRVVFTMLALLLFIAALVFVMVMLVRDQRKLNAMRTIQRGLKLVSLRASKRLQFRTPEKSDRAFLIEMTSDPTAAEANGWSGDEPRAIEAIFSDRSKFKIFQQNELIAFERSTRTQVATATFGSSPIGAAGTRSIGVHVHPDHRRKGYGREVMAAAIALMQYTPGPVYVGTHVTNVGMQRIMEQLGFEADATTRPYTAPNGESYEAYWYRCGSDTHAPLGLFEV